MKSYQQSLERLDGELDRLNKYRVLLKQTPPGLYRLSGYGEGDMLVITKQYRLSSESYRNKINMTCIADETSEMNLPYGIALLLNSFIDKVWTLTPVDIKELPLYIGWPSKSTIFEEILRTGKLPRSIRSSK
jgi:hypothetical protein